MTDNNNIPEKDRKLAQKVGDVLEKRHSVQAIDNDLISQIVDWKRNRYQLFEHEVAQSRQQSWESIHQGITPSGKASRNQQSESGTGYNFLGGSAMMKVAAVFVLAALISVLYMFLSDTRHPVVLIQSGSELVMHIFDDGSRVNLRPHSTLYIVGKSGNESHYRLEGEAFFNVSNQSDRRFLVEAGYGTVEVIGTTFNVREWGDQTTVFLQEGSLLFSTSDGSEEVILKPGELVSVNRQLSISEPVQTDGTEFLSWQQSEIVFNNRTAESIFRELEHHYSITILAPEPIKKEVLGGTLSLENESLTLKNLGIVLGGNFSSIEENTYQFVE